MKKGKYILQYGKLAGGPYHYAKALRNCGVSSKHVVYIREQDVPGFKRELPTDIWLSSQNDNRIRREFLRAKFFFNNVINDCSLVHYHGLRSILPTGIDYSILHRRNIPMVMSFGGGDVRITEMAASKNPYFYKPVDKNFDRLIRKRLQRISKYIKVAATDCEVTEYVENYFEHVFTLRQAVDIDKIVSSPPRSDCTNPLVLHIPTEPEAKGSSHVFAAVERLKAEGVTFRFKTLQKLSQQEVLNKISSCDIYVDELLCGSHGVTAVESMASGKPTITFIRKDLVKKYPHDLPLISANPDTLYDVLKATILNAKLRTETGIKSRCYAEKYHSHKAVAETLLEIYRTLMKI